MSDLASQKRALRRRVRGKRALSTRTAARAGRAVAALIAGHRRFTLTRRLALFASLDDEIPTRPLFEVARQMGRECLFPRCLGGRALDFALVDDWDSLQIGGRGALEPPPGASSQPLSSCELAFVPGVAFDRFGGRLGRGAGYYDRALSKPRGDMPFLCGLSYAFQLVDRVPMGLEDVRVDAVACETAWLDACSERGEARE